MGGTGPLGSTRRCSPNKWPGPTTTPIARPQGVVRDSNPATSRPQPQSLFERLVFKEGPHFWAAEFAQDLLELLSVGSGWPGEVGELGLLCISLNSSASKLRSFLSSSSISLSSSFVRISASSERLFASSILLSTSGSRRQLSNCCAEAFGYDSHNRQRGNDEAGTSLLVEGDDSAKDVEVVIGAIESNQANNKAADELEAALGVKAKKPTAALLGFRCNLSNLAGTGVDRPAAGITELPVRRRRHRNGPQALRLGQELQHQLLQVAVVTHQAWVAEHHPGHPSRHHLNDAMVELLVQKGLQGRHRLPPRGDATQSAAVTARTMDLI